MAKFIYHDENLRCRIKYIKYLNHYELQLQKRLFIFWVNVYEWMTVKEDCWGRFPVVKMSYQYGNISEIYKDGTLDFQKRIKEFFQQYFDYNDIRKKGVEKLEEVYP